MGSTQDSMNLMRLLFTIASTCLHAFTLWTRENLEPLRDRTTPRLQAKGFRT